jgi:hypothetical protein
MEIAIHRLEIFTASQCWRGDLAIPSMRRLSDFFNDKMHDFVNLTGATLLNVNRGILIEDKTLPAVSINQQTIIAVVRSVDPSPVKADTLRRVQKQPFPIEIFAPPFIVEGKIHLLSDAQMYEAIDAARQNFIVLTDSMISMDGMSLLPLPAELVLVNRLWMTAFHAISP